MKAIRLFETEGCQERKVEENYVTHLAATPGCQTPGQKPWKIAATGGKSR
jgi:hypothetical protein